MAIRLGEDLDPRDFKPYTYPSTKDLRKLNFHSVCLGSYIPWDVKIQSEIIMNELDWRGDRVENIPNQYNYEKIECYMQGVRDYIKYLKRGYTRPTHLTSIDIRNNRLDRETGNEIIKEFEGKEPPSLEIFLKLLGIKKEDFYKITRTHAVSPWKIKSVEHQLGEKLPEFNKW